MRKKRKQNIVTIVRLVSWFIEVLLAGLFLYAYLTLVDLIPRWNIRLAISIFALPIVFSFWIACCIGITLVRENWILGD